MIDDFKKAQQEKLARMQGIKLRRPEAMNAPKRNRIEEALGRRGIADSPFSLSEESEESIPSLQKRSEVPPSKVENSPRAYSKFLGKFFLGFGIIVMLLVVSIGGYIVFYNHKNPGQATADQTIQAVAKLTELPAGETPTVATVSDLAPLKGQEFFSKAALGDKVLIFDVAKEAILYRPSDDKIITKASLK